MKKTEATKKEEKDDKKDGEVVTNAPITEQSFDIARPDLKSD